MRLSGKKLVVVLSVMAAAALIAGCGRKEEPVVVTEAETTKEETTAPVIVLETETEPEETEPEEPLERVEVDGKIRSYLTGEMKDVAIANRRPVAVMMSNDKESLPQYGMSSADIVYEAPVEGDMNRYMAIIEDYDDLERIGSVRSCRTYYTYFAREFDAVYAHFGQSTFAVPYLKNVDNINGIEGKGGAAFYRTKDRKAPHNAYTSGARLNKLIGEMGYQKDYHESYDGHFKFARGNEQVQLTNGQEAYKVVPGYPYNKPWFEYNEDDGLYYRYQYGGPHKSDKGQIAVKNIIFQFAEYGHYATTPYLNINVHTGREGMYFTNGRGIETTWKKDGEFGPTHYYDKDGNEITLNKGKTWICILFTDKVNKVEVYGK